uniref:Lipoprotein n=1 Tax=Heterorhabditis bacteriophora TaxID=37862 RepID=A0A1I7X3I2_HETBA
MMMAFNITPITGREMVQKNFIKLPDRALSYSDRHVSLNERFSVIERGYYLDSTSKEVPAPIVVRPQPISDILSKDEFTAKIKAETEKRRADASRKSERSQVSTPESASTSSSTESVSP